MHIFTSTSDVKVPQVRIQMQYSVLKAGTDLPISFLTRTRVQWALFLRMICHWTISKSELTEHWGQNRHWTCRRFLTGLLVSVIPKYLLSLFAGYVIENRKRGLWEGSGTEPRAGNEPQRKAPVWQTRRFLSLLQVTRAPLRSTGAEEG